MTKPEEKPAEVKSVTRQSVETELRQIPYSQLVVRTEDYSFREEEELSGPAMRSFEDEIIASRGLTTPLFVRDLGDGTNLVLDGHKRYIAVGNIIERLISGFSRDMLIPANVVVSPAPERELLARAISANFQRSPIGALGRIKAAVSLTRHGMPKQEIARILGIGTSTLDRDLLLGTTEWVMDHIRRHHITPTTASALLDAAKKAKRVEEFRDELEEWVANTKARLREQNRQRQARDEDLLAGADLWPQKHLTRDQIDNWAEALRSGQPFGKPAFKFKALIRREKGTQRIEIDGLSKDVSELSAEDVGKVYERFVDMGEDLILVLQRKLQEEGQRAEEPGSRGRGRERLRQLGLGEVADRLDTIERAREKTDGEADSNFDQAPERVERDLSETAELPRDAAEDSTEDDEGETAK